MCEAVRTATALQQEPGYDGSCPAFKVFFMANITLSLGPLVRLLAAIGAISSLLLMAVLNLVH